MQLIIIVFNHWDICVCKSVWVLRNNYFLCTWKKFIILYFIEKSMLSHYQISKQFKHTKMVVKNKKLYCTITQISEWTKMFHVHRTNDFLSTWTERKQFYVCMFNIDKLMFSDYNSYCCLTILYSYTQKYVWKNYVQLLRKHLFLSSRTKSDCLIV